MALFMVLILVVLGFGFLGSRVGQYQSTGQSVLAAQARALARAGIENARAKLNYDIAFPPLSGPKQFLYNYSEEVTDSSNTFAGSYKVTLDASQALIPPYYLLVISSQGLAGPKSAPLATHTYRAYLDVSPILVPPSPTHFQIVRFDDLGAL